MLILAGQLVYLQALILFFYVHVCLYMNVCTKQRKNLQIFNLVSQLIVLLLELRQFISHLTNELVSILNSF